MITKTKNQIQKMGNDIEGILNDFEGGITEKEGTIVNIIDYIIQRAEATLNNFKRDLMISVENRRKFYLENNRPDNASTLEILYNDIKNDQLLDFMEKDGLPVEAQVKPANGVSREDKIMELLQDFWDEYNNNKAVVWLRNDNTGQLAIYTRGEYANDLIQFISRLSV